MISDTLTGSQLLEMTLRLICDIDLNRLLFMMWSGIPRLLNTIVNVVFRNLGQAIIRQVNRA